MEDPIITFVVDEVEKYSSLGLVILPYEDSFLKIINQIGCANRREFMLKLLPGIIEHINTYNTIYSLNLLSVTDIFLRVFPNTNDIIATDEEFLEYKLHLEEYSKVTILWFFTLIKSNITSLDEVGFVKDFPSWYENYNNEVEFLYDSKGDIIKIPEKFISYTKRELASLPQPASNPAEKRQSLDNHKDKTYFYWPYVVEDLERLEKLLLKYQFIEYVPQFKEAFNIGHEKQRIKWNGSRPEAYFLLYKIYNGETFNGEYLNKIADNIFFFGDKKNDKSVSNSSYNKFQKQLRGKNFEDYTRKKLSIISYLINHLIPLSFPTKH